MYELPRLPAPAAARSADHSDRTSNEPDAGQAADQDPPHPERDSHRGQRRNRPTHTPESLLDALGKLPVLIATGVLLPAQANSIRAIIQTMLTQLQPKRGAATDRSRGPIDFATLRNFVREQPLLLDFLTPFLSAEEIDQLLREEDAEEDANGS